MNCTFPSNITLTSSNLSNSNWQNQSINVSDLGIGNITLSSINLSNASDLGIDFSLLQDQNSERIKKLENQLQKIVDFINVFFDTKINV